MVNREQLALPQITTTTKRRYTNLATSTQTNSSRSLLRRSSTSSLPSPTNNFYSAKMSTRQSYVFLGLTVLLTILATVHSGPVSTTTQAEVSNVIFIL